MVLQTTEQLYFASLRLLKKKIDELHNVTLYLSNQLIRV